MKDDNTIGVDLAKNVIYACVVSRTQKVLISKEFTRAKFKEFLAKQKSSLVAFEACATTHYWSRYAQSFGHHTKILPALAVAPFRQGHKTDKNDALAVAEAASRPNIKQAPYKTVDQQVLQSIQRSRELLISDRTALVNHIRGILLEFGLVIRKGISPVYSRVPEILEDGENELPNSYRSTLNLLYTRLCDLRNDIGVMDKQIAGIIKQYPSCGELTKLEGVGPIGALLLFSSLGTGEAFKNGREFSAYLGLTPKQYSSGGKTQLVGISKHIANKRLRAVLIQGARAYVHRAKHGNSTKDKWLLALAAYMFSPLPPTPVAGRVFYPHPCHHELIGTPLYGYYGFICRPSVHHVNISIALRA